MYKRILVPTDGSPLSVQAAESAVAFARGIGAELVAVSIAQPFPIMAAEAAAITAVSTEELMSQAADNVAKVAALAAAAGVPCHGVTSLAFFPHEEIINTARDQQCDLIMMASHGRNALSAALVGSETQKVLSHCHIPVLVYREEAAA